MAASEPSDSTASNKDEPLDGTPAKLLGGYLICWSGGPLADRSRQAYGHQVRRYLPWLGTARRSTATRSLTARREIGRCATTSGI